MNITRKTKQPRSADGPQRTTTLSTAANHIAKRFPEDPFPVTVAEDKSDIDPRDRIAISAKVLEHRGIKARGIHALLAKSSRGCRHSDIGAGGQADVCALIFIAGASAVLQSPNEVTRQTLAAARRILECSDAKCLATNLKKIAWEVHQALRAWFEKFLNGHDLKGRDLCEVAGDPSSGFGKFFSKSFRGQLGSERRSKVLDDLADCMNEKRCNLLGVNIVSATRRTKGSHQHPFADLGKRVSEYLRIIGADDGTICRGENLVNKMAILFRKSEKNKFL